jgi:hypothetical protein
MLAVGFKSDIPYDLVSESPDQIIRFAAAITIPVTKAAKQENSRRSSNTALVIGSTPVLKGKVPG